MAKPPPIPGHENGKDSITDGNPLMEGNDYDFGNVEISGSMLMVELANLPVDVLLDAV